MRRTHGSKPNAVERSSSCLAIKSFLTESIRAEMRPACYNLRIIGLTAISATIDFAHHNQLRDLFL